MATTTATKVTATPVTATTAPVTPVVDASTAIAKPIATIADQFDMKQYVADQLASGNSAITSAQQGRDLSIQARLNEQTALQAGQERDAVGNFTKASDTINANTYDAQENQRANGVNRGIQYSQQQQGLENGISNAGAKLIVDAGAQRDVAIANIRDRIASLKNGASLDTQASQSQADAEKAQLATNVNKDATQRQWTLDDMKDATAQADRVRQEGYSHEVAMKVIDYTNQVNLLAVDNKYKVAFLQLDTAAKLKILGVQNANDLKLTNLKISSDKFISNMKNQTDVKIAGIQSASAKATAQISAGASIRSAQISASASMANTQANIAQSQKENVARINSANLNAKNDLLAKKIDSQAQLNAQSNKFLIDTMKADPTFNIYGTDAKSVAQRTKMASLNGVSLATLNSTLGIANSSSKTVGTSAQEKAVQNLLKLAKTK